MKTVLPEDQEQLKESTINTEVENVAETSHVAQWIQVTAGIALLLMSIYQVKFFLRFIYIIFLAIF